MDLARFGSLGACSLRFARLARLLGALGLAFGHAHDGQDKLADVKSLFDRHQAGAAGFTVFRL